MVTAGRRELISQLDQIESNRKDVITPAEAESLLVDLAAVFLSGSPHQSTSANSPEEDDREEHLPKADAIYRALVEQVAGDELNLSPPSTGPRSPAAETARELFSQPACQISVESGTAGL